MTSRDIIELAQFDADQAEKSRARKAADSNKLQQTIGGAVNIASSFLPGGKNLSALGSLFGR